MKPEVGPVCRGRMHYGTWPSPGLRRTRVRPLLTYRQNLLSSLKTTERHPTLQSTLSRHQSSRAWRCHGVSGSLARGTRDLSSAANRLFPKVLCDTADATCAQISSLDAVWVATTARTMCSSWRSSVPRGRPEPGLRLWECSTDHCWKQRHTTTNTLCPKYSTIRRCLSNFPYAYNATPSNGWSCSRGVCTRRRTMLVAYPRVNVKITIHLWNHKDRPLERYLIADDRDKWITNTTTSQYAHIITLVPMNTVLENVEFFQQFKNNLREGHNGLREK